MDKRPLGPAPRPHCLVDNPCDRYDAFSNNDQCEESHSHVEMSVLESYTGSGTGYSHNRPHLKPKYRKPNGPNVGPKPSVLPEGEE